MKAYNQTYSEAVKYNPQSLTSEDLETMAEAADRIEDVDYELEQVKADLTKAEDKGAEFVEELEALREFFTDCFARLNGEYPCPSWSSDYDKSVIFEAIEKGSSDEKSI